MHAALCFLSNNITARMIGMNTKLAARSISVIVTGKAMVNADVDDDKTVMVPGPKLKISGIAYISSNIAAMGNLYFFPSISYTSGRI